jgi:hypothetical protein
MGLRGSGIVPKPLKNVRDTLLRARQVADLYGAGMRGRVHAMFVPPRVPSLLTPS